NWRSVGLVVSCSRMTRASMAKRSRCSSCSIRVTMWSSIALVKVTLCVERINFIPLACNFITAKSSQTAPLSTPGFASLAFGAYVDLPIRLKPLDNPLFRVEHCVRMHSAAVTSCLMAMLLLAANIGFSAEKREEVALKEGTQFEL